MVKERYGKKNKISLGSVSLSVDEIIQIVEGKAFASISADNNDMEFESLDDIKNHKPLLAGYPSINCDGLSIWFSRFLGNSVNIINYSDQNSILGKSIAAEIKRRKTWIDFLQDNKNYVLIPCGSMVAIWFVVALASDIFTKYPDLRKSASVPMNVVLGIFVAVSIVNLYVSFFRHPVYYAPSEGFVRRNLEKIILIVIGSLIGWGIKWLLG